MNTNFTPLEGQDTRHAYNPTGDLLSPEGLQTRLEDALRPVLTTVQRQLAQMARAQIDAALEPMHDAIRRQVDLTFAPMQATLMAEVDRALDLVREEWRRQVERALEPVQQLLDAQIDRALQPLFGGAKREKVSGNTDRRESSVSTTATMDSGLAGDTHQERPQAEHTQGESAQAERAQAVTPSPAEVDEKKPKRRATPGRGAEAPKRPSVDQAPKPPSSARSAVGQSSTRSEASASGTRSSMGQSTVRSSVAKSTVRSSVPRAVPRTSTVKPSRKKSASGANSDA